LSPKLKGFFSEPHRRVKVGRVVCCVFGELLCGVFERIKQKATGERTFANAIVCCSEICRLLESVLVERKYAHGFAGFSIIISHGVFDWDVPGSAARASNCWLRRVHAFVKVSHEAAVVISVDVSFMSQRSARVGMRGKQSQLAS